MRGLYLAGWLLTRPVGLFVFYFLAEPILTLNVWFKKKWLAA